MEFQQETVKGLNDVFHAAKSMSRQAIKIVSLFAQHLVTKMKPLTVRQSSNWKVDSELLLPILFDIESNFKLYFSDINDKFEHIGAKEWIEANSSVRSMQAFANKLNLVDETISHDYWNPVVEIWSKYKPSSSIQVDNISSIIITKNTSAKCLTAIATAVAKLLKHDDSNENNKNNILIYLRSHLPSVCFRGDNFSMNFIDCMEENINKINNNSNENTGNENEKKK
jgi:hypothetical protein